MDLELEGRSSAALDMAADLALALGTSKEMPLRPQDAALLAGATPFRFGPDLGLQGWSLGQGPVVALMHGYGGLGVQMAPLAQAIAAQGYRCVFFDAGGHGASAPGRIGFDTLIRDSAALYRHLECEIHAWIGHSAGGLAMMRARALQGLTGGRYAVIAAPIYPYVPLVGMRGRGASPAALEHVKALLSDQFRCRWSQLAAGAAFAPETGTDLLAIYDRDDVRVSPGDGARLATLWPGARVLMTEGHGHNRILRAPEVEAAVLAFL